MMRGNYDRHGSQLWGSGNDGLRSYVGIVVTVVGCVLCI